MPVSETPKRIRRTPEEARALILDAADTVTRAQGLASLRLQDVAREAGVSHPTILHHFGSREGLVQALNARAMDQLTRDVVEGMAEGSGRDGVARTFATYRGGVAERLVWLIQAGMAPPAERIQRFEQVVASLHEVRRRFARPGHEPDIVDTRHVIHLTTVAAIGDALFGQRLRQAEDGEEEAREAFERFLSGVIDDFLEKKA